MADTADSRFLLHTEHFNHFCRNAYLGNKKCSSVVSRVHASAIKHFLREDYEAVVTFFNAETWDEVDELELARFKFHVANNGFALKVMSVPHEVPVLFNYDGSEVLVVPNKGGSQTRNGKKIGANPDPEEEWLVVVCVEDFYETIRWAHHATSHGGETLTERKLQSHFSHIPLTAIREFIKGCPTCSWKKKSGKCARLKVERVAERSEELEVDPGEMNNRKESRPQCTSDLDQQTLRPSLESRPQCTSDLDEQTLQPSLESLEEQTPDAWRLSLLCSLYAQQQQNQHCDVQLLTSEGWLLGAHACVLAAASPTISDILAAEVGGTPTLQTVIPRAVLDLLLELVYTGKITSDVSKEAMQGVCQASTDMGITIWPELLNKDRKEIKQEPDPVLVRMEMPCETDGEENLCQQNDSADNEGKGGLDGVQHRQGNSHTYDGDGSSHSCAVETKPEAKPPATRKSDIAKRVVRPKSGESVLDPSRPFLCDVCPKTFCHKRDLDKHMLTHTGERPFLCQVCSATFARKDNLKAHLVIHSQEKPFQCHECGAQFARREGLKEHQGIHVEGRPLQCDQCGKSFKHRRALTRHHRTAHRHRDPVQCDLCGRQLKSETLLQSHKKAAHYPKTNECNVCGALFGTPASLRQHTLTHRKPYKCKSCPKGFAVRWLLEQHLLGNSKCSGGRENLVCSFCSKAFRYKLALIEHEKLHTSESSHRCCECGKGFVTAAKLRVHTKMLHMEDSPLKCTVCSRVFPKEYLLRKHFRTHTDPKKRGPKPKQELRQGLSSLESSAKG